jgi:hypothetical protein
MKPPIARLLAQTECGARLGAGGVDCRSVASAVDQAAARSSARMASNASRM